MGEIADPAALITRLDEAHGELAATSATERLAMLARAVELWDDSGRIGRAAGEIATATGYAPAMVALCLRRTFAAHRAPALADLLADALAPSDRPLARTADLRSSPASEIRRRATAPALVVAILAQNTPGLAIAPALQALALGSAVVLKPASGEPHFALRLAESLGEADPRLGAACAVVTWKGGRDAIEETILAAASRVVVYGSAPTIASIRERVGERAIAFGPRVSLAVVARAGAGFPGDVAARLARDVAFLDQRGCLSPQAVLVERGVDREALGRALGAELAALEREWPRRRLDASSAASFRRAADEAESEAIAGRVVAFHGGGPEPWAVVVEENPALRATPLDRFVRLHPFAGACGLRDALGPLAGSIECVGLDADEPARSELEEASREAGATRICPLGAMQDPPASWHSGGRLPLSALLQWSVGESAIGSDPATTARQTAVDLRERFARFLAPTSESPRAIEVVRARGAYVFGRDGAYLDLLAGIGVAAIGHAHPDVTAAIARQAVLHAHVMVYGEDVLAPQVDLAERLASHLPAGLSSTYLTSSGAEAIEGALKLVRKATGRARVLAFEGAYHGDTTGALALGGNPFYREPFRPLLGPVEHLPWNDASALERIDRGVAGVFVEPVQAEAGVRIPDAGFLPALARRCREVGALVVYDEVVTGLGRTGRWFALEHWPDAEPDVLVLAKALGGGLPLGAFVASPELTRVLARDPPLGHITTFGGNPVSCAAALATLDVLERERLPERAAEAGRRWLARLGDLIGTGRLVGARGLGLLIGLDLASPEATRDFVQRCLERRVLLGWTLHDDTVVRLAPPLNVTDGELEEALAAIRASLG